MKRGDISHEGVKCEGTIDKCETWADWADGPPEVCNANCFLYELLPHHKEVDAFDKYKSGKCGWPWMDDSTYCWAKPSPASPSPPPPSRPPYTPPFSASPPPPWSPPPPLVYPPPSPSPFPPPPPPPAAPPQTIPVPEIVEVCECTPRPEITEAIVADVPPSGGGLLQYSDAHTVELSFTMPRTDDGNRTNVSFYRVLVYDVADSDVPPPSPPSPPFPPYAPAQAPEAASSPPPPPSAPSRSPTQLRQSPPPLPAPSPPPTAWWILHRQQRQQAGKSALVEPQADVTAAPAATVSTWAEALQKQQLLEREAAAEA